MTSYKVAEHFISVNGEGQRSGQLAYFVRFQGCNLACSYCDTSWANAPGANYTKMSSEEIHSILIKSRVRNVTLTGGEPLIQDGIDELISVLTSDPRLSVEIETNGSVDISPFIPAHLYSASKKACDPCYMRANDISGTGESVTYNENKLPARPIFTIDYKLPGSGCEEAMLVSNFTFLQPCDTIKFVAGSAADLWRAKEITDTYRLTEKCDVHISPVFGKIEPAQIVSFMKENRINGMALRLQTHKIIWDPKMRGV